MTTLAAIQGDGWSVIGAESRATDENGFIMHAVTSKIFHNGPATIAASGSVRGINLLQYGWKAPSIGSASVEVYMTQSFIPAMRKLFIDSGYDMKEEGGVAMNDNALIISVKGVLFSVADDYSWERCLHRLYVSGSGYRYALGALAYAEAEKSSTPEQAERYIRKAIAAAIKYDAFSGGKIDVVIQTA